MESQFDLLVSELAAYTAGKNAPAPALAKAMPAATPRPKPPTLIRPFKPAALVPQPQPISRVETRRREMLAAADRVETRARGLADAGLLTGPEFRLLGLQIAQLRRDAEALR